MTDLSRKIARALADRPAMLDLMLALRTASVHVMGEVVAEGEIRLSQFSAEDKATTLIFTSRERGLAFDPAKDFVETTVSRLLSSLEPGAHLLIDPGADETIVLNDWLVDALREGDFQALDPESFNGLFFSGTLKRPHGRLQSALRDVFARHLEVEAAFMTLIYKPDSPEPPIPAIGILGGGDPRVVLRESARVAEEASNVPVTLYLMGDDALSKFARQKSLPFYWREEPVAPHPAPLDRDELIEFVAALPAEPPIAGLLGAYLHSGNDEAEAREMWKGLSLEQKNRFPGFPRFLEYYTVGKKSEILDYRAASTHAEAKALLLERLRAGERICVYLRNFAGEAVQSLEPEEGTDLLKVQWFSHYDRPVDRAVHRLLEQSPQACVALGNARDALGRLCPIPQIEVADEDWIQLMVSLVAMAPLVFLNAEEISPGVAEELMAIQRLGREDETVIILSDEDALQSRQDLRRMALGTEAAATTDLTQKELGRKLAVFGRVVQAREMAEVAEFVTPDSDPGS